MRNYILLRVSVLLVLTFVMAIFPAFILSSSTHAQDKSLVWERFDSTLSISRSNEVRVTEIEQVKFLSGTWRNGSRTIPLDRIDEIKDVSVEQLDSQGQATPLSFNADHRGNDVVITWSFDTAGAGDVRTFRINYTAVGVVRLYPNSQQIRWQAVPPDRAFPVQSSTVRIVFPEPIDPSKVTLASYPERLGGTSRFTDNTAVFTVRDIPAYDGFEVRAEFPAGIVEGPPPSWQAAADRADYIAENIRPIANFISLFVAVLLASLGTVFLVLLWYTKGKDPDVGPGPSMLKEPPSDLPAPLVGVLIDGKAGSEDVVSTIVSLAEKGVISLEPVERNDLLGSNRDYRITLLGDVKDSSLFPHERALLWMFFNNGDRKEIYLSEAKQVFTASMQVFTSNLYEEVVELGLFKANPESVRKTYRRIGWTVVILGVLGALVVSILFNTYVSWFLGALPFVILAVLGMALVALSEVMPVRTVKGAIEAKKWLAFRNYLARMELTENLAKQRELFEKYLSYATVFGLSNSWIKKFSSVGVPAPSWYRGGYGWEEGLSRSGYGSSPWAGPGPIIIFPPFGGVSGSGHHGGSSGSVDSGEGLHDNTGLTNMGDGRGVLDRSSAGLADLLDMASDAFGSSHWGGGGAGGFGGGSGGGGAGFS